MYRRISQVERHTHNPFCTASSNFCSPPSPVYTIFPLRSTTTTYDVVGAGNVAGDVAGDVAGLGAFPVASGCFAGRLKSLDGYPRGFTSPPKPD